MGDKNQPTHFKETYWYVVGLSLLVLLYVIAVTFLPIPKENVRFVDISFGFLLNLLVSNSSYLTGGNPTLTNKKSEDGSVTLPAENKSQVTTTVTTEPAKTDTDVKEVI